MPTKDRKIYCSLECFDIGRRRKPQNCKNCGIEFVPLKTVRGRGVYCSRKCYGLFRAVRKTVTSNCLVCGNEFTRERWRVQAGNEKPQFCSQNCYAKFLKEGHGYTAFKRKIKDTDKAKIVSLYEKGFKIREIAIEMGVSYTVMRKYFKYFGIPTRDAGFYSGKNSEQYIRNYLNGKLNHTCQRCGWNQAICDAHHIQHRKEGGGWDFENMILLCPNCHRLVHQGLVLEDELKALKLKDHPTRGEFSNKL